MNEITLEIKYLGNSLSAETLNGNTVYGGAIVPFTERLLDLLVSDLMFAGAEKATVKISLPPQYKLTDDIKTGICSKFMCDQLIENITFIGGI